MPAETRSLRRSVLLSWIASYALILLIPNVFSLLVYFRSGSVIEDEINRSNTALLKQVQQAMDSQLREVERFGMQIAFNARVVELAQARGPLSPEQKYKMSEMLKDFKLYATLNGFIDDFYVYFRHTQSVMTSRTYFADASLFYRMTFETAQLSYSQWLEQMNGLPTGAYTTLVRKNDSGSEIETIAFARSVPVEEIRETPAQIVILFDTERFRQAIRNLQWVHQGAVLILDGGRVVASTAPFDAPKAAAIGARLTEQGGIARAELDGEPLTLAYVSSEVTKWTYVSVLPSDVFLQKAKYVRNLTVASLLLCTAIGVAAAVFFARRNYNPVRELLLLVAGRTKPTAGSAMDEYEYIKHAIHHTLGERDRIHRQLEQQKGMIRANLLLRLMKGRLEAGYPLDEALTAYDLPFVSDRFAVMLIYIEDFAVLFDAGGEDDEEKKLRFVYLIVQNIVGELIDERHRCYSAETEGMIACLVNLRPAAGAAGEEDDGLADIAMRAQTFIRDRFHIAFTASISGAHPGIDGIAAAYQEALEAMEYKMVYGMNRIIVYDRIRKPELEHTYAYPLEQERQLINYMQIGDFAKAEQALLDVFAANGEFRRLPVEVAQCLIFDMIGTIMKTINEMNVGDRSAFAQTLKLVPRVLQCADAAEMKREMTTIVEQVCRLTAERRDSRGSGLKEEVLDYIAAAYQDVNLSVSTIAEHFRVSSGHLSRLFKEQSGESMLDAINRVRLARAKELLAQDGVSIAEAAVRVGYYNSNAFIRTFKKYEGITPGQYKMKL
ncbi:helix-turn-helix domain-containing protein [Paenibacillus cymbidii]|uniref:helix-turn-helix domain-containing protein n=1 Tax=Paenibacillus cymbidii TaxID=1639034 RepID=UPI001081D3C2|nr:helix-turn-helix domain-containing protein [Paenibacillus cymbidii]